MRVIRQARTLALNPHLLKILVLLSVSILSSSCATYLGYHFEGDVDGPKTIRTISQSSSIKLEVIKEPSKYNPTIVFQATNVEKVLKEATWKRHAVRMNKYVAYSPKSDLFELIIAWAGMGILPAWDSLSRLFGMSTPIYTDSKDTKESRKFAKEQYVYDVHKPELWYLRNWIHWFGWFLPGINAIFMVGDVVDYDRTIVETEDPRRSERFTETTEHNIRSAIVELDLGPAGSATAIIDENEVGRLDLKPYMDYLAKDFNWKITASVRKNGATDKLELAYNTSELGVTWGEPKIQPGKPARLDVQLAVYDADGDGMLKAGETARATVTVRNVGQVAVWDLRVSWDTSPSSGDELSVREIASPRHERLDSGQSWETSVDIQAAPEWTWEGAISINAKVEDVSKIAHPKAHATLAARSFDPPRLELARLKWSDGNDEVLRPGDKVMLRLWVQNTGLSEARGVRVALHSKDENLKLLDTSGGRLQLKPSELKEFTWQLNIPESWQSTGDNASGQLPIDYVIREERTRYWTMTKPLRLELGAQAEGAGTVQEAAEFAALQEEAKKTIAAERETKDMLAQLQKRRRDAEVQLETEERRTADEIDKIERDGEARKRQLQEQKEALERKYGQQSETYQQEIRKLEAEFKKQEDADQARLAEFVRRDKEREEQRKLEQSALYQLRKRSYAVIVGINKYDDPNMGELKYAVTDAKSLAQALADPQTGLFTPENVKVLITGAAEPSLSPTKPNVITSLNNLAKNLQPEDRLLFFFAGHGTTDEQGKGNYLLTQEVPFGSVEYLGLKLEEEILDVFDRCQAKEQIVIVDACHSGLRKGARDVESRDLRIVANRIENALEAFSKRRSGRAVLMSSSQDQKSQEDDSFAHGVFTYYIVEGLRALATDPTSEVDGDLDGRIEAGELFQFVQDRVESWCHENQRPLQSPNLQIDNAGANIPLATRPQEQ